MTYDFLSVIVPAHNEEENIGELIRRVYAVVPGSEIIVIDDGSTDGTSVAAKNAGHRHLKVLKNKHNAGKGRAVRQGISVGAGRIMVQIDADLQFLPEEITKLIKPILENKADITFGSRYIKGDDIEKGSVSAIKRLASFMTSILVSLICFKGYTDVFAGMKAWKSEAIRDINLRIDDFGYEAEIAIMARRKNYRVIEVPVNYRKRLFGQSKIKLARDTLLVCRAILKTVFFRI